MKNKSSNMKKGVSLALSAMMVVPTTTASFAAPINGTTKDIKDKSIPYNVLNQKVLSIPDSPAEQATEKTVVYTGYTEGATSSSGDGTVNNPYNRFEDAVANVADGGTIYIKGDKFAFLNDVGGNMPFVINKNVTIKPVDGVSNATLSVRSAGIMLGANVTFENITLSFANKYHDSIFANGHTLNLINVTRAEGTREIDLFAGGLYKADGTQVHPSGNNGVINIETTDSFGGGNLMSKFGNIYAGSMNGVWNGSSEINVSNSSTNGSIKRLDIGAIKASGALEAVVGDNFFDQEEPAPPTADATRFPVIGNVEINLYEYQVEVDGTTGGSGLTSVTATSEYTKELKLKNVDRLTVASGKIKPLYEESVFTIPNVTVGHDATLDLTNSTEATIGNYDGDGVVVLRKDGKLNITNPMQGSLEFQAEGATYDGESLEVNENHVYITTPNEDAFITFKPYHTQTHLDLVPVKKGDIFEWTAKTPNTDEEPPAEELIKINGFTIEEDTQTMTAEEIKNNGSTTSFKFKVETEGDEYVNLSDYDLDITINGKEVVERDYDYFVEELGLAVYFSEVGDNEYELVVIGSDADDNMTDIAEGRYDVKVACGDVEFTAHLNVTNNEENLPEDEDKEEPPVEEPSREYKVLYFDEMASYAGYRPATSTSNSGASKPSVNRNQSGNLISVMVDGEPREYSKGYSAFGNSNLYFDARFEDKKTYTRAVGKLGIDSSQKGVGNGVDVKIYLGNDMNNLKLHKTYTGITADQEAINLDLDLTQGYIMKFEVTNRGNNDGDAIVLADMKLVETDYVEEVKNTEIEGLKRVAEYDEILKNNSFSDNLTFNKMVILQREFVKKVGYQNIKTIAETNEKYFEAINFLMTNEDALNYLITGGDANVGGSYTNSIRHFCEIYSKHGTDLKDATDNHFNLRLAISTSLAFANHNLVRFWIFSDKEISAVTRYETYQNLVESGVMDKGSTPNDYGKWSTQQFKELPVPLMRWVVDNRINDDEAKWLADFALAKKDAKGDYLNAYSYIKYTTGYNYDNAKLYDNNNKDHFNDKYGNFTNYFNDYGKKGIYRLWMVFEEGSVCGGLAKTYANVAEVFGRPSSVMGQPGHAATMTWGYHTTNKRYEWMLQNDIYGWSQSGNEYNDRMLNWGNKPWTIWHNASYNVLATDAVLDNEDFMKATTLNLLANSYDNNEDKKEIYLEALEVQPINLDSMEGLVNAYKADENTTSAEYLELAKRIISTYTYYPQVMMELLALIESEINNSGTVQLDILKNNALTSASNATPDVSTNVTMSKQLANKYLNGDDFGEVATFSFNGENAGEIVMNSKYNDAQITLEYSLDGGNKWIQTNEKVITLSEDELASITAENDIKVRLVGVDTIHTIDILEGETITDSKVFVNDYENLLLGDIENLEFSVDGNEWCDYVVGDNNGINQNVVSGIRFDGAQTVKVRYKAHGTRLQSAVVERTFTENTEEDTRKYVQLKNVKFVEASAHQNGQNPELMIDGKGGTGYHTNYNTFMSDKFYTVEFDKPRYITSMEYVFVGGNNGRMKAGTIEASMDGVTWETIKTFSNIPQNVEVETYDMDVVTEAKFIKLVPTETHGNTNAQINKFFAGKEIRFFEDTTKVEVEEQPPVDTPEEEPETPPIVEPELPEEEDEQPSVEEVTPDEEEGWLKTTTLGQVAYLWNYEIDEEDNTVVLKGIKDINAKSSEFKVEIPKTVGEYKVALENLNNDVFEGVTHIRIAEGEGTVGLLATQLTKGFEGNTALQYVDLEGLDVSKVTAMDMLFSKCDNLQFIKILDWEIQDNTNIESMFYARLGATDEQKKILVVTNHYMIDEYDFALSNRLPHVVTYEANGGNFGYANGVEILNMAFHRYTIGTDNMDELVDLPKHDEDSMYPPTREGYEFKGWYTEESTPTNVFELINMTYKAEWEKIEEVTPETPDEDYDSEMGVDPDKDQVVDDKPTILPDDAPIKGDKPEEKPPVNNVGGNVGDIKPSTPPSSSGGGGGGVQSPSEKPEADKEEQKPATPTSGIENLKELDKDLQQKVDSIIAETTLKKQELMLSIVGDKEDIKNVNQVEVTKDGIFAIADNKKLKFGVMLEGLDLDLTKARVIRVDKSRNSIMRYSAVPYRNTKDGIEISSNDFENILITSKVAEPFVDVNDKDWFKADVEEAYNYGFTQGTSLDTYNPKASITRGEFAVMIARALELKAQGNTGLFADVKGKWYENEVQALKDAGIVLGLADGTFGGDKTITRQEAATFITRMLTHMNVDVTVGSTVDFIDMDDISAFAKESVQYLASQGVLVGGGDNKFSPTNNLTRAEMAKILVRSIKMSNWY